MDLLFGVGNLEILCPGPGSIPAAAVTVHTVHNDSIVAQLTVKILIIHQRSLHPSLLVVVTLCHNKDIVIHDVVIAVVEIIVVIQVVVIVVRGHVLHDVGGAVGPEAVVILLQRRLGHRSSGHCHRYGERIPLQWRC